MQRVLAGILFMGLSILTLFCSPADVLAQKKKGGAKKGSDGVVENWGKPKHYAPTKVNAFWIWYTDDLWHLRTTGGGKGAHHFKGTIEVIGGRLDGLNGKKGEFQGKLRDQFVFNTAQTAISFDFNTDEGEDGINFSLNPAATGLSFNLLYDGIAAPNHIRLGRDGDHPSASPFTVPARPVNRSGK